MSTTMTRSWRVLAPAGAAVCAGCGGLHSTLEPAGQEAARIATLFWWMAAGAVVIWVGVIVLALVYGRPHEAAPNRRRDRWLILGAGVTLPIVVLSGLLAYGLSMLPPLVQRAPEGSLLVHVEGEQWWWRVRYVRPDGSATELANEVRLPVGEPVQFKLTTDDVIHSFWIPAIGGKVDMIPGRINYLALNPSRTGRFGGWCAEYCGTSHAFMRFMVEVMERPAFDAWLAHQAQPAVTPAGALVQRGQQVLVSAGCGACHTVRGTAADGEIGPDLTHVGSRLSLAAGTLPNDAATLARWIARPEHIKPGVHMPAFGMLDDGDILALAAYLESLE